MSSDWIRRLRHCHDERKEQKLACECQFRRCEDRGDETAWITLLMFPRKLVNRVVDMGENVQKRGKLRAFDVRWETPVTNVNGDEIGTFRDIIGDCLAFKCGDQILCDGWIHELSAEESEVPADEASIAEGCAVRLYTERCREVDE